VVDAFEKAMKGRRQVDRACSATTPEHAFVNEQRMSVHDRKSAELAWGRAHGVFSGSISGEVAVV